MKYLEEIPKYFNGTLKENIFKKLLFTQSFPFYHNFQNRIEYRKSESKADKSIINKVDSY